MKKVLIIFLLLLLVGCSKDVTYDVIVADLEDYKTNTIFEFSDEENSFYVFEVTYKDNDYLLYEFTSTNDIDHVTVKCDTEDADFSTLLRVGGVFDVSYEGILSSGVCISNLIVLYTEDNNDAYTELGTIELK